MTATAPTAQKTTLGIVMGILNVSNMELGRRLGINTQNVQKRRTGDTKLTLRDIQAYASALGIPPEVLAMNAPDVFRWFADHSDIALETTGELNYMQGSLFEEPQCFRSPLSVTSAAA